MRLHLSCVAVELTAVGLIFSVGAPSRAGAVDEPLRDTIDGRVRAAWQQRDVTPAPPCDDATFLRRVFLDLVGTIPTYDEAVAFLRETDPEKRAKLIDRLLADPRFARHQAEVWDQVFFGRNPPGYGTDQRGGFLDWLTKQFSEDTPYDVWARAILKAEGNTVDEGAPMYFVQYDKRPEDATEAVTRHFLGIQLQCARCHDHPFEAWSQLDFYGMAAFFARLQVVNVGKKNNLTMYAIGETNTGDVLFTGPVTEQEPGKKGEPVPPTFLDGDRLGEPDPPTDLNEPRNFPSGKVPPQPKFSRKDELADWITRPDNPYFARAVANRVWAQFLGRGIVHPVDNMSESNPPSHGELLAVLAQSLVAHKFDLKWYIRELVTSQTYQLAGVGPVSAAKPEWFERARCRPLSAEELLDTWRVAVGYDAALAVAGKKPGSDRYEPLGSGYLLRFFGRPNNGVGDFQGGLHEHLYMNNGGLSKLLTTQPGSLHHTLVNSDDTLPERVDRLYLTVLSRPPAPEEQRRFVEYVTVDEQSARDRWQEVIWVLVTCSEFRFNH